MPGSYDVSEILRALYEGRQAEAEELASDRVLNVFEAAALGEVQLLEEILADDPDAATAWSPDGFTALHYAVFFGGAEAADALLEAGADITAVARNDMRVQPLHSAVANRLPGTVELLLERGAPVNVEQRDGFTPLMAAEQHGDDALIALLKKYGAER